jgi:hypothetical protein
MIIKKSGFNNVLTIHVSENISTKAINAFKLSAVNSVI